MQTFADFLRSREHVDERRMPYYLRWAQQYLAWAARAEQGHGSLADFLRDLSGRYEDWQVQQARRTVQLYSYYRSLEAGRDDSPLPSTIQLDGGWDSVPDAISSLLRLKHLSLRTEKAYLEWIRRFQVS